jgi:mono/diheme cytochrome c family protein
MTSKTPNASLSLQRAITPRWVRVASSASRGAFALLAALSCFAGLGRADDIAPAAVPGGASALPESVTFNEHVAPIVFTHCAECHRPGEAAPFSLLEFADVRKRARMIVDVTKSRYMPPWHPEHGWGEFVGDRRLGDRELATIEKWVDTGLAEGDPAKLPERPKFTEGWRMGEPDLVVTMSEAFEVPADGRDIYRNFVIPLPLEEDRWVSKIEIRPSARSVVHHALYFYETEGSARELDARDETVGFSGMGFRGMRGIGGWAVGAAPMEFPEDVARPLPKGADFVVQTHFHPSGKVEHEKSTIGFRFAKKKPSRSLVSIQLPPAFGFFAGIDIPPGEANSRVVDSFELVEDAELFSVGAHAHFLGKEMKAYAKLPDGTEKPLFWIRDWDFNWQGRYHYKEPVRLPKGSVIHALLTYDNSTANPQNPFDPPRRVRWGLESTNEMAAVTFMAATIDESRADSLKRAYRRHAADALRGRGRTVQGETGEGEGAPESSGTEDPAKTDAAPSAERVPTDKAAGEAAGKAAGEARKS